MKIKKSYFNDKEGRKYTHYQIPQKKPAILCLNKSNMLYNGDYKIIHRTGNSKFGNEFIFEFRIDKLEKTYDTSSPHNVFEVYFTEEEAISLLQEVIQDTKQKGGIEQMDIKEFTKSQGEFLKAEEVKDNPANEYTITATPEVVHNEKFNKDRLHVPLILNGQNTTFDCSKTNARKIVETLGEDGATWVGHKIKFHTYKMQNSEGKMIDAIGVESTA